FLLILAFGASSLHSQQTTARFLLFQPSAESNAMGGTGVAQHNDAFATYYNPAALAFVPGLSTVGSFVKPIPFLGNTIHSYFSSSLMVNDLNAIALSANLYRTGKQVETGQDPTPLSIFGPDLSWQGKISFAHAFNQNISLGISGGVVRYVL